MLIRLIDGNFKKVRPCKIITVDDIKIGIEKRNKHGSYFCTHYPTGILLTTINDTLYNVIPEITTFVRDRREKIIELASKQPIINKE